MFTLQQLNEQYEWLANSPLAKSLDDAIDAPVCHINERKFSTLFNVIKFWQFEEFPQQLLEELKKFDKNIVENTIRFTIHDETQKEFYMKIYHFLSNFETPDFLCIYALEKGHLDLLEYAHKNNCYWDERVCQGASKNGHLKCLKYAHENGCQWNIYTCERAAFFGNLDCLKYAHENNCPWDYLSCTSAAGRSDLDSLKYLHENGCPWEKSATLAAAALGRLDSLKYLHENGCPFDKHSRRAAASEDHFECFMFLRELGVPFDINDLKNSRYYKGEDISKYEEANILAYIAAKELVIE